jgi:hypothetical protein
MNFLQNTYQILFKPQNGFDELIENYNLNTFIQGLLAFALAHLIANQFSPSNLLEPITNLFFLSFYIFMTAYIFVLKGRDFFKLVGLFAFTFIPLIFTEAFDLLSFDIASIKTIFRFILLIWVFNLQIIVITKLCGIGKAKATLLYLLIPFSIAFFVAVSVAQLVMSLFF